MSSKLTARGAVFAAALLLALPAAATDRGVQIIDYGIYDHVVTEVIPEPKDVAGERTTVANIRLREQTLLIDAQRGRMFGYQFKVTDPALYGKTLATRKIFPLHTGVPLPRFGSVTQASLRAK